MHNCVTTAKKIQSEAEAQGSRGRENKFTAHVRFICGTCLSFCEIMSERDYVRARLCPGEIMSGRAFEMQSYEYK